MDIADFLLDRLAPAAAYGRGDFCDLRSRRFRFDLTEGMRCVCVCVCEMSVWDEWAEGGGDCDGDGWWVEEMGGVWLGRDGWMDGCV